MQPLHLPTRFALESGYIKSLFPLFFKGLDTHGYWKSQHINNLGQHEIITHFNRVETDQDPKTLNCLTKQTRIQLKTQHWHYIESCSNHNKRHLFAFDSAQVIFQYFKSLNETHSEQVQALDNYCTAFEDRIPLVSKCPARKQTEVYRPTKEAFERNWQTLTELHQADSLLNIAQGDFNPFILAHHDHPELLSSEAFTHRLGRIKLNKNRVQVTSYNQGGLQAHQGKIINLLQLNQHLILGDAGFKYQLNLNAIKHIWHWRKHTFLGNLEQIMLVDQKGQLALSISRWI